jgi:hypothetical protein
MLKKMLWTFTAYATLGCAAITTASATAIPPEGVTVPDPQWHQHPCEMRRNQQAQLAKAAEQAVFANAQLATPIYIGGVRYVVDQAAMVPVYTERYVPGGPCPGDFPRYVKEFAGYSVDIPVDGDEGQSLFFDISGRAGANFNLSVSCGSFSAADQGNKFFISQRLVTNHSCKLMRIELKGSAALAPAVQLTISIAEEI